MNYETLSCWQKVNLTKVRARLLLIIPFFLVEWISSKDEFYKFFLYADLDRQKPPLKTQHLPPNYRVGEIVSLCNTITENGLKDVDGYMQIKKKLAARSAK